PNIATTLHRKAVFGGDHRLLALATDGRLTDVTEVFHQGFVVHIALGLQCHLIRAYLATLVHNVALYVHPQFGSGTQRALAIGQATADAGDREGFQSLHGARVDHITVTQYRDRAARDERTVVIGEISLGREIDHRHQQFLAVDHPGFHPDHAAGQAVDLILVQG